MKAFTTIIILAAVFLFKSTSSAADALRVSPSPLELGLNCNEIYYAPAADGSPTNYLFNTFVEFRTITNISIEVSFRNIGEKWIGLDVLFTRLSVVWDGIEYQLADPEHMFPTLTQNLVPKSSCRLSFLISDFVIPPKVLTVGRHTVAVRDEFSETNTFTYNPLEHPALGSGINSKSTKRIFAESGTLTVFITSNSK